ncbi:unnamed protein product [Linum trigynum]|uniref:Uncharacterized protein n=1 Tax=Linum trigynum TaxID=586398 RepID=A0AAV2D4X5_9ROSI
MGEAGVSTEVRKNIENQTLNGNEASGVCGTVRGSMTLGDFLKEAKDAEEKEWGKVMETISVTSTSTANESTDTSGVRGAVHCSRTLGDFLKEARDAEDKECGKVMETTSATSTSAANEFTEITEFPEKQR